MRPVTIAPDTILEATVKYAAANGLENTSVMKVAKSMGISDGTIFRLYSTKADLFVQAMYYVDRQVDAELKQSSFSILHLKDSLRTLWVTYFRYLAAHGDYAKYCLQMRHSSFYTPEIIQGQNQSFSFFSGIVAKNLSLLGVTPDIFWVFVLETTLNLATRVADGKLPGDDRSIDEYYKLIFYGVSGILKKPKDGLLQL